jgi:ATP-dependent HslUV protease subunit HslV
MEVKEMLCHDKMLYLQAACLPLTLPTMPRSSFYPTIKSTTVLAIKHKGEVAIAADGQATLGNSVAKTKVKKLRRLCQGQVVTGFAGATADAFTLLDRFDAKLSSYAGNMKRAAIELAKDWRTDRYLRKLEAMIIAVNKDDILIISGTGDVLDSDDGIAAIGSGSMYALSAARALKKHAPGLTAKELVKEAITIAADICIYTNHNITIEMPGDAKAQRG